MSLRLFSTMYWVSFVYFTLQVTSCATQSILSLFISILASRKFKHRSCSFYATGSRSKQIKLLPAVIIAEAAVLAYSTATKPRKKQSQILKLVPRHATLIKRNCRVPVLKFFFVAYTKARTLNRKTILESSLFVRKRVVQQHSIV